MKAWPKFGAEQVAAEVRVSAVAAPRKRVRLYHFLNRAHPGVPGVWQPPMSASAAKAEDEDRRCVRHRMSPSSATIAGHSRRRPRSVRPIRFPN